MYEIEFDGQKFPQNNTLLSACFKILLNHDFLDKLKLMSEKIGFGNNIYGFNFPDIFDEGDIGSEGYFENGIEFYLHNSSIVLDYSTFYEYIKIISGVYVEKNQKDEMLVNVYLDKIRTFTK